MTRKASQGISTLAMTPAANPSRMAPITSGLSRLRTDVVRRYDRNRDDTGILPASQGRTKRSRPGHSN